MPDRQVLLHEFVADLGACLGHSCQHAPRSSAPNSAPSVVHDSQPVFSSIWSLKLQGSGSVFQGVARVAGPVAKAGKCDQRLSERSPTSPSIPHHPLHLAQKSRDVEQHAVENVDDATRSLTGFAGVSAFSVKF